MNYEVPLDIKPKRIPLILRIRVCEIDTDKLVRTYHINFNRPDKKDWLHKTLVWAAMNKKYVEIINVVDDNEEIDKDSLTH